MRREGQHSRGCWILRPSRHRLLFSRTWPLGVASQADVAQLVERNLAKVEVASSSLVVRSERRLHGGVAERRGNGLQIRLHGFKSRLHLEHRRFRMGSWCE